MSGLTSIVQRTASKFGRVPARLGLLPLLLPRRIDLCGCGISKSGTHSLEGIFGNYRSEHHPDADRRIRLSIQSLHGKLDEKEAERILSARDRQMWLELESSALAGILVGPLSRACPQKKFILTLRDVYSWCDSWINHNINKPAPADSPFRALDAVRLDSARFPATQHDAALVERGFPSLAAFFHLWTEHNTHVLETVAPNRLLILKTAEIPHKLAEIAAWSGIAADTLRSDMGWLATAPRKHGVLERLDPAYVEDLAGKLCGPLMSRYFPDARLV